MWHSEGKPVNEPRYSLHMPRRLTPHCTTPLHRLLRSRSKSGRLRKRQDGRRRSSGDAMRLCPRADHQRDATTPRPRAARRRDFASPPRDVSRPSLEIIHWRLGWEQHLSATRHTIIEAREDARSRKAGGAVRTIFLLSIGHLSLPQDVRSREDGMTPA